MGLYKYIAAFPNEGTREILIEADTPRDAADKLRGRGAIPVRFCGEDSAEGGSSRNYRRVIGVRTDGERWSDGVSSVTFRLELGWTFCENFSAFAFVEQYEIIGQAARHAISASSYRCAHNDWTLGGIGCRLRF